MRQPLLRDIGPTAAIAAVTLGALIRLVPAVPRTARVTRSRAEPTPAGVAWTAPPFRLHGPAASPAEVRRAAVSSEEPAVQADRESAAEESGLRDEALELLGISGDWDGLYLFEGERVYGRHRAWRHRSGRRAMTARGVWAPQPALSWVGAEPAQGTGSACELLPALCGELRPARAARPSAAPSLREEPTRLALSNELVEIDIARVGRCAVRVRRAEDHADTLLTFDLPDELVPCEARVVPDLLHADGVALRIEATAPRWTQTITVALAAGDDAPTVTIARATRDGDNVVQALVNAGAEPVTFNVAGRDVTVAPGGVAHLPRG